MRSRRRAVGLLCVIILGATCYGAADQIGHGHHGTHLENAWARRTPPIAQQAHSGHAGSGLNPHNGAVYVTIKNHGQEPDALMSVATPVATSVELHETIEQDGKRMMQPRSHFDIPPGGTLELQPGSYHLMLLGLKQALMLGETVPLTLTFRRAGEVFIAAQVR